MRPDQLPLLTTVSGLDVHPDGSWAVAAVSRPDFDADASVGQLWRVPLTGDGAPRRLTRGFRDTNPRFSPDGRLLAFVRTSQDGKPQLHVMPTEGGEPLVLTDRPLGVSEVAFSPDSTRIAFTARVPQEGRYGTVEGVSADAEDPRRITSYTFQMNGVGYIADQRSHVFVLDVPDVYGEPPVRKVGRAAKAAGTNPDSAGSDLLPTARQLTEGDADHTEPVFTADGRGVVVTVAREDDTKPDLTTNLFVVALDQAGQDGSKATRLTNTDVEGAGTTIAASQPCVVGDTIFFIADDLGPSGLDFVGRNSGVYVLPAAGGEARRLTDAESVDIVSALSPSGDDGVVTCAAHRGSHRVVRVTTDGNLSILLDGPLVASIAAAVPRSDAVVAAVADGTTTGDLTLITAGAERRLTDFSAPLRAATRIAAATELEATSPDGYPVHGWTLLPDGPGPHPVLLLIHGGPYADYTWAFFDEAQTYVEAGYAVVMCNPRGAAGYGQQHGRAIQHDFGNLDMADILAFLDHALDVVPGLDRQRLGVMGGSYGGYMTAWIIGHDHRFAGAIVERGFLDPRSFVGASDIGWYFTHGYNTDDPARMDAQSPMHLTSNVTTPTLVIHSEQDLRCPLSQALRYYTQLKLAGVETELLVFPGENHELSRSGQPWHRRQRLEAILEWWARHLPVNS